MLRRRSSIRFRITLLVLLPLLSLVGLWGFTLTQTVGGLVEEGTLGAHIERFGSPLHKVVCGLQEERRLTVTYLHTSSVANRAGLERQRELTDTSVTAYRNGVDDSGFQDILDPRIRGEYEAMAATLAEVDRARLRIDSGQFDTETSNATYSRVIARSFQAIKALVGLVKLSPEIAQVGQHDIGMLQVRETIAWQTTIAAEATAVGELTDRYRTAFVQAAAVRATGAAEHLTHLPAGARVFYERLTAGAPYRELERLEGALVHSPPGSTDIQQLAQWQRRAEVVLGQIAAADEAVIRYAIAATEQTVLRTFMPLLLASFFGLVAVVGSVLFSVRMGRNLMRGMVELRDSAMELAEQRLPNLVERLRRGEQVDMAVEAPELALTDDELGQVGRAFNAAQRTAVQVAVSEAELRRGVNEVFRNLARRNQALLHRQLGLLDSMEHRANEPDQLAELFRLDHLATRMRRHAEGLIIMAGGSPGRKWRSSVPLTDVVRGAASEVEEYVRVVVDPLPDIVLIGPAVADTIHLLAELIENATVFSPPHAEVEVRGQVVGTGVALEIEDRGIGMDRARLEELNARLANPSDNGLFDSAKLGLYVVSQLARRQSVTVTLCPSAYGGVKAVVLFPRQLVEVQQYPEDAADPEAGLDDFEDEADLDWSEDELAEAADEANATPEQLRQMMAERASQLADQRPARLALPVPSPASDPGPARGGVSGPPDLTDDGLPRRVRQANLTPRLAEPAAAAAGNPTESGYSPVPPEELRERIAAIQAGWNRGRVAAALRDDQAAEGGASAPPSTED